MNTENARSALREVLGNDIWSAHYRRLCEFGVGRIDAESGRYHTVLAAHGVEATLDEVRDALRSLAVLIHPSSPAAREIVLEEDADHRWLDDLDDLTMAYLRDHNLLDTLDADVLFGHVQRALRNAAAGDRRGARAEYRELIRAARESALKSG